MEIQISGWKVIADDLETMHGVFYNLGASQPANEGQRQRAEAGDTHGWIFRTTLPPENASFVKMKIRREPLRFGNARTGDAREITKPLIAGSCNWQVRQATGGLEGEGTLDLSINPTRFVRHRPIPEELPHELLERTPLPLAPYSEAAYDSEDNWLPQSGRLQSYAKPSRWRGHLGRYLKAIENAFSNELAQSCESNIARTTHAGPRYNLGTVETYWEWLSDDPLKVVYDLQPLFNSYTRRKRTARIYENVDSEIVREHDLVILNAEISPGETLKIYAKTNQRIRMELMHRLTGRNNFRFPRERENGNSTRPSTRHIFDSRSGLLTFLDKMREHSAEIINEFLAYCGERAALPLAHASGYYLLSRITDTARDFPTAISIISRLVNNGSIAAGQSDEKTKAVLQALTVSGVLERRKRGLIYEVTEWYRHALRALQLHGSHSLLEHRRRRRNVSGG